MSLWVLPIGMLALVLLAIGSALFWWLFDVIVAWWKGIR